MPRKKLICPKCSSENAVKILYGEPAWEAELAATRGEECVTIVQYILTSLLI